MLSSTKTMVAAIIVASVTMMASYAVKASEVSSDGMSIKLLPKPCHLKGVEGINQGVLLGYGKPIQGCWQQTDEIVYFNFYYSKRLFTFKIVHDVPKNVNEVERYRLDSITSK